MPRRPRLSLPNVPLHLIQRGNNRQACFHADEDLGAGSAGNAGESWPAMQAGGAGIGGTVLECRKVSTSGTARGGSKWAERRDWKPDWRCFWRRGWHGPAGYLAGREIVVCPLFTPPNIQPITSSKNLQALDTPSESRFDDFIEWACIDISQENGLEPGDLKMFTLEPPTVPLQPVAIVAQANTQIEQKKRAIGYCVPWDYIAPGKQPAEGQGAIGPNYEARSYFSLYEKREVALPPISAVQLIKGPQHGTVTPYNHPGSGIDGWRYLPEGGYTGNDRVEFLVDVQGMPVRVVYYFKVTKLDIDRGEAEGLCKQFQWKISSPPSTLTDPSPFQSLLDQSGLDSSSVTLQVADLTNSSLGQTTGTTIKEIGK